MEPCWGEGELKRLTMSHNSDLPVTSTAWIALFGLIVIRTSDRNRATPIKGLFQYHPTPLEQVRVALNLNVCCCLKLAQHGNGQDSVTKINLNSNWDFESSSRVIIHLRLWKHIINHPQKMRLIMDRGCDRDGVYCVWVYCGHARDRHDDTWCITHLMTFGNYSLYTSK